MKKLVVVVLFVAFSAFCMSAAFAEDVVKGKVKETVSATPEGGTVTTVKGKLKTDEGKAKGKIVTTTTPTATGSDTVTKGKIVLKDKGQKMTVKVLQVSENDAASMTDNTVTVINEKNETLTMGLSQDVKINDLKGMKNKKIIVSSYPITPETMAKDFPNMKAPEYIINGYESAE